MSTSVYEVLDELGAQATSNSDKGYRFERLMAKLLQTDPMYADQFSAVWLWHDWPGRDGKHDTGIDIVAVDRVTGADVAIQCKFYDRQHQVSKNDIDTFLSASGKSGFGERIIVSTTDKWNHHAEDAIRDQQIPVRRISLADLEASVVDWDSFDWARPEALPTTEKKRVRPHQRQAIDDVRKGLATQDRGRLVMACGTGKTFTALRLAEEQVGAGGSVLFLVPSISLLAQTLREWAGSAEVPLTPMAVCSDPKVSRKAGSREDISTVDLALPATTDATILSARLRDAAADGSTVAPRIPRTTTTCLPRPR